MSHPRSITDGPSTPHTINTPMIFKIGTTAQNISFVPSPGQPIWNIERNKLTVGDGITPGGRQIAGGRSLYTGSTPMTYLGAVNSELAMLSLVSVVADSWVIRSDTKQAWVYIGGDPHHISSWAVMSYTTTDPLAFMISEEQTARGGVDIILNSKIDSVSAEAVQLFTGANSVKVGLTNNIDILASNLSETSTALNDIDYAISVANSNISAVSAMLVSASVPTANQTTPGVTSLATTQECMPGLDNSKIVTPEGARTKIDSVAYDDTVAYVRFAVGGSVIAESITGYFRVAGPSGVYSDPIENGYSFTATETGIHFIFSCDVFGLLGSGISHITHLQAQQIIHLPSSLLWLHCASSSLTSLAPLPASLQVLRCHDNQLTKLPALPVTLQVLSCHSNQLTKLPALPPPLVELMVNNNQLSVQELNDSMVDIGLATSTSGTADISYNPGTSSCNVAPAVNHGWTVYASY